ncbi:Aste57867_10929 [Aphanomyces stellatus]|uniref:Aste57867_10929 protein n=1 Tax=Aphanomyces stellatus TaxID=120398 RepID=A0A485KTA5_9STRA|nr:hypothetical protein As57867_010889 [Aphanomyces stellatus]VFT87797.1 Aste57867_10929 [Aphanomyces stellatus]
MMVATTLGTLAFAKTRNMSSSSTMAADLGLPPKRGPFTRSYSTPDVHHTHDHQINKRRPLFHHRSSTLPLSPPLSPVQEPEAPVDVFLGGSCNPTTWRIDVAMPMLDAANVSYYNPQVDEWHEGLMRLETHAKDTSSFVLFVIDNQTRSIVSMNEAAEFMCCGRRVVLVVEDMPEEITIEGAALSSLEISDLNAARACLRHFSKDYPQTILCESVPDAIEAIVEQLARQRPSPFSLRSSRLRKRSSVILSQMTKKKNVLYRSNSSSSIIECDSGNSSDDDTSPSPTDSSSIKMVYLGGNITNTHWRAATAIPMLQKAGLRYYSPRGDFHYLPTARGREELKSDKLMKHKAALVLVVIPNNCRSISAMIDAIALICSGRAVILVIEPMLEGMVVEDGSLILGREFKDLTRARLYLEETATRHDICIHVSAEDAIQAIVAKAHEAGDVLA